MSNKVYENTILLVVVFWAAWMALAFVVSHP